MLKKVNKKLKGVAVIISITVLIMNLNSTYSKYTSSKYGSVQFGVAKPICEVVMTEFIYVSNFSSNQPLYFYIRNYDDENNASEVGLNYYITINTTQSNAPLIYSLYRVYDNGNEEMVEISVNEKTIKTVNDVFMSCEDKCIHNYRLDVNYDENSNIELDKDFRIAVCIKSEQA